MQINVLFFAVFRERLKRDSAVVEVADGSSVADAIVAIEKEFPPVANLRGRYQIALNQEMVGTEATISDGDELVLIPPVAGGIETARIVESPPSLDRIIALVSTAAAGGLVTFTGMVRDHSQGRAVVTLEYEAYKPMAEGVIAAIINEVEQEWPGVRAAVEHRVGVLTVGDIAVAIACAAPHRGSAFAACRAIIDRLKDRAPIWKKEIGPDGAEWVGLGP